MNTGTLTDLHQRPAKRARRQDADADPGERQIRNVSELRNAMTGHRIYVGVHNTGSLVRVSQREALKLYRAEKDGHRRVMLRSGVLHFE